LPIIVLSANVMREHVAASAEAGADDHVGKPVRAEALIQAVLKATALPEDVEAGVRKPGLAPAGETSSCRVAP
jgi:CheY-like chemotaxis protein